MTAEADIPPAQKPKVRTGRRLPGLRTTLALVIREMSTTNGRSPGGYLWAVLEPVLGIALLSLIFSVGFRSPRIGINFPIFYATGMIPFLFFTNISGKLGQALNFSRQLLAYPTVTFVDALLARFIVNAITQLMVGYIVFTGIILMFETRVVPNFPVIAEAYLLVSILAMGVGTMNCFLMTRFPIWQSVWSIFTRPLFLISCIFFIFDTIPMPYKDYLWYNPLVHVVGLMRRGFYPNYDALYVSQVYVAAIGLVLLVAGLALLWRYHRDILER